MAEVSVPNSGERNLFLTFIFSIILIVLSIFNLFWYRVGFAYFFGIVTGVFGIIASLLRHKILMLVYLILALIMLAVGAIVIIVILVYANVGDGFWWVALVFAIGTFIFLGFVCFFGWKSYQELS